MSNMHQVLILLQAFLEASTFFLFKQIKVIGSIQKRLDQTFPGTQSGYLWSYGRAHPRPDHQHQLRGALGLQAGQQLPVVNGEEMETGQRKHSYAYNAGHFVHSV